MAICPALGCLLFFVFRCEAQNLVPNGSFEDYSQCPWANNQVDHANGWERWYRSPDYFNACSDSIWASVPLNWVVNQAPSHGQAYCGFIATTAQGDYSEIIGAELAQDLVVGQPVFVSLKLAIGTGGTISNYIHTCDKVGVRFTTTEQQWLMVTPLPNYAHLVLADPLQSVGQWFTLSGTFTPDSTYRYISIGRFHTWDSLQIETINPGGVTQGAYFLVDEVCVGYDEAYCDFGLGLVDATTGDVMLHPNPFTEGFWVKARQVGAEPVRFRILDSVGRELGVRQVGSSGEEFVSGADLPLGLYVVEVWFGEKEFTPIRAIKARL